MLLGKLPVLGVLLIWIMVGPGLTVLAVGAGRGCFGHFLSSLIIFPFSPSLSGRRPDID